MIDLRSDTVTRPTPEMYDAMMRAPIGDDVLGDDPTVRMLEDQMAMMFGFDFALFCPSGTMTNQIALALQSGSLEEIICHRDSHIHQYEVGGAAYHSRSSICALDGDRGKLTADQIESAINPDDVHKPKTVLVALENSTNKGGGDIYQFEEILKIKQVCDNHRLKLHLDGARLFNALAGRHESLKDFGQVFDSISICLSKGLGAPVGSVLLTTRDHILKAKRYRKVFGGGMRQAGILAAAGLYALENHVQRLQEDYVFAKSLEELLSQQAYVEAILPVKTNIVIFDLVRSVEPQRLVDHLKARDILCLAIGPHSIRFVTHLDVTIDNLGQIESALREFRV
ncbi:MAG: hypothetical protein KDD61_08305 [Bdellovibrionales bacterium]|nr:hypothetical protein [Bdellovibrionales bacterium]